MPITKHQAMTMHHGTELHYTGRHDCTRVVGPRGGVKETVTRCRISGACQTWKTRPADFRLPVKYGMYESSAITEQNAGDWHTAEDCPLNKPVVAVCKTCGEETGAVGLSMEGSVHKYGPTTHQFIPK